MSQPILCFGLNCSHTGGLIASCLIPESQLIVYKDFGTYRKYGDGMIVVQVIFWSAFVGRCYKSNFKARQYDPCCNGKVDDVCQGLCHYDSNNFEKTWWKVVRSSSLFMFKFFLA